MAKQQLNEHGQVHKLEYNMITDHIYIGTNMCCQTHFEKELLDKGIEADLSLEEERIDAPFGVDFFVWLPVKDHTPPTQEQLSFGVKSLENFHEMNKKVYVHCKNGHGRAPTMVAAFLMATQGMSTQDAIEAIKKKRPVIHLEASQVEALEAFEQSIT